MILPGFFEGTGMPDAGWWEALWPQPDKVLAEVGLKSGMRVVDLCSGDGWFTLPIARVASHVTAIDLDADLVKLARVRLADSGITNCEFVVADAYELPALVSTPADFVFMANAFHGAPDKLKLVRAIHEVLKPGGLFAAINWHARPREQTTILGEPRGPSTELRISLAETIKTVLQAGMQLGEVIEVSPYHYGAIFSKPA